MAEPGEGTPLEESVFLSEARPVDPEKTKLQELERIFGTAFRNSYKSTEVKDIQAIRALGVEKTPNPLVESFLNDLVKENIEEGRVRILAVEEEFAGRKTKKYLGVVEHGILDSEGNNNSGIRVMEVFPLGSDKSTESAAMPLYGCQDIVFFNNSGKGHSAQIDKDIRRLIMVRIGGEISFSNACGRGSLDINLLTTEERIAVYGHEVGHGLFYKGQKIKRRSGEQGRDKYDRARSKLAEIKKSLKEGLPSDYRQYASALGLLIEDEQSAWRIAEQDVQDLAEQGFPILSGDNRQKMERYKSKYLGTYEEAFKPLCDVLNQHFLTLNI